MVGSVSARAVQLTPVWPMKPMVERKVGALQLVGLASVCHSMMPGGAADTSVVAETRSEDMRGRANIVLLLSASTTVSKTLRQ